VGQSATGGYRGLFISPTVNSSGSLTGYYIDAGTNSAANGAGTHTSYFNVDLAGNVFGAGTGTFSNTPINGAATLDFPSIAANAGATLTATVTGAVVGRPVSVGLPAALAADIFAKVWVSATNTVSIRLFNFTGAAIDPASASFTLTVFK